MRLRTVVLGGVLLALLSLPARDAGVEAPRPLRVVTFNLRLGVSA